MRNEPVRGSVTEPGFYSLSGLEQLRAFLHGRAPATPHARLLGYRLTQASSGNAVFNQPISPWFDVYQGFVDLTPTAEVAIFAAALTTAPPGAYVRVLNMSLRYLRPLTVDSESVITRGRVLHVGSTVTTVEAVIEDALGRVVAHATGSTVLDEMAPPPPALSHQLEPVDEPVYATPDPPRRPLEAQGHADVPPLGRLLGVEVADDASGSQMFVMRTSEWFCNAYREVAPGVLAAFGSVASATTVSSLPEPDERAVTIHFTYSFLAPVDTDGRELKAAAALRGRRGDGFVLDVQIMDEAGGMVLLGQAACLLRDAAHGPPGRRTERLLLTVLFTDLVGSTEQLSQLGDARGLELLDAYRAVVRRALNVHKGREVKTTGDGFLATFDSPTRAVRCAAEIRQGVERIGVVLRAGIHTGECDLVAGDVGGLAVHVASRLESAAVPGEILVSTVVRDLVSGSGLALVDRGERDLKGLDGKWRLFAVE